jgi:membrane associated rhomboid family serine protease
MHGGLMHFAGNMMFLWVFGDNIEDRMGHVKYLVFYLAAGVVATLSHWLIDPGSNVPLIGASGAIAGVLGAYLFTYPHNRVKVLVIFFLITVIQMRAMWLLAIWFGWQLIQGVLSIGISNQVSVAFFAHIGGFVFGAGVIILYRLATKQPIWPPRYSLAPPSSQFWRGRPLD